MIELKLQDNLVLNVSAELETNKKLRITEPERKRPKSQKAVKNGKQSIVMTMDNKTERDVRR